ncbi:MAG: hypothetical protein HYR56_19525 [Acidobacteria bacterium]|nr:hypothetical protein [Acidobacteriota bacterium]MBI3426334.1 hypothetical protein [Acidobacteriota bacterium]
MRIISPATARHRLDQRGSILGVSAIAILAILGVVGLAVDISHMYLVLAELQNAADAAALAGASGLNGGQEGIQTAIDRASAAMNKYEFNKTAVGLAEANVTFAANLADFGTGNEKTTKAAAQAAAATMKFVKVSVPAKTVSTVVAKAFMQLAAGGGSVPAFTVGPSAIAGQSVELSFPCNYAPLAIVYDGTKDLPVKPGTTCANQKQFTRGCVYVLTWSASNSKNLNAGEYVILNPTTTRATDLRARMAIGADGCAQTSTTQALDTGAASGQVRQGLNTRLDDYQSSGVDPVQFPPDLNVKTSIGYGQYKDALPGSANFTAPTHTGFPNRRVLVMAMVQASSFVKNTSVTISSFGAFFMRVMVPNGGADLEVEYIGDSVVLGNGGYTIGSGHLAGLTVPVLYR